MSESAGKKFSELENRALENVTGEEKIPFAHSGSNGALTPSVLREYVTSTSESINTMSTAVGVLRTDVDALQEQTTQMSDDVFFATDEVQTLKETMRMKANVSEVPALSDFNQVSDDVAFALDEVQGLRETMRMKAEVSDVSQLREQVESEITAREEAISTIEHPVELADTEDADFMIADENQNAILTIKNGHIKTAKFDSSNIQTQSSTTSATATATSYRYYQPYNAEADLLFRDARLRARYSGYLPLIFVCGQSNADGRADYTTAPEWLSSNDYKVEGYKMWNAITGQFSDYSVTGNNGADGGEGSDGTGANKFSFDPFFAKSFVDEFGGNLYAIRQSMGGISIQSQPTTGTRSWTWQPKISTIVPGCNSMCLALMNKYKAASDYAEENNLKLLPIGVLWHQGESDADEGYCAEYKQNLMNVVSWIRGMVDEPTLPFVSGYVMRDHSVAYRRINVILSEMETYDPYCKAVDMDGHYTSIDGLHYDADALAYMGETMFGIYKDIAYKQ